VTTESIIHSTCTRIRAAKGLPECIGCAAVEPTDHGNWGEPLCHYLARAEWDKESEND
jgi:hypothetical protein